MNQTKRGMAMQRPAPVECEGDEEVSGIHPSMPLMLTNIAIGAMGGEALSDEPVAVYATQYVVMGGKRVRYARDYYLGTRFTTGVIPSEGWDDEMHGDGVSAFMIDECREYLAVHAL